MRLLIALLLVTFLIATGCAKAPPPNFYLLAPLAPAQLPGFESGVAVGIGPVELPPHLDRNQIVSRDTPTRLRLSEQHHWAEPLKVGFTRVLLVTLGVELDSNRIYTLPTRRRRDLDFQVAVDVLRFDGQLGGEIELAARWTLFGGKGEDILSSKVAHIRVASEGADHDAFVAAQSRAITELGQQIAAVIDKRRN